MDRVLVAYAGSAGGEIALVVGEQLCRAGLHVDVRPCARAERPEGYRAVVLGSTVREGRWSSAATDYLSRHAAALSVRPLWLYETPVAEPDERVLDEAGGSRSDGSVTDLLGPAGAAPPVRFEGGGLVHMREWGFILGCQIRPLTSPGRP